MGDDSKNKYGQLLGDRGCATRQRLMNAARDRLKTESPIELTALAIAQAANTSSGTFYLYFNDVKDIMFSLCQEAGEDMSTVFAVLDEPWDHSGVEVDRARRLMEAFDAIWDRHRDILRYRNLEADRGDPRFKASRIAFYTPVIERLAGHILATYPPSQRSRKGDALAEASVLYAALECISATDPRTVERGVGVKYLLEAKARVVARVLGKRQDNAG